MQAVGRSAPEHRAFEAQLLTTHRMRVTVKLLDLAGDELADLTDRLVDGQVDIDATAETSRAASVTLDDPNHSIHLDSDAPAEGGLYLDRMLAITYGVFVDSLGKWLDVPVFTGPLVGMSRDGDSVALSCLGKEHLAKGNAWHPMTLRKGMETADAIRAVLRERAGESEFSFPTKSGRLADPLSLGRMTQPWALASQLARSTHRQLYYDGAGVCHLRRPPTGNAWTFKDGDGGSVLSPPQVSYDLSSVSNVVWVKGKKPKKHKPQVTYTALPSHNHPLSPWRLGRGGVPRFLVTEVDNDKVRSRADAKDLAEGQLAQLLREGVEVDFDALPIPHLDPGDPVRLDTAETSLSFSLVKASIPLVHSGVMSVGANRRVTPDPHKIRTRR